MPAPSGSLLHLDPARSPSAPPQASPKRAVLPWYELLRYPASVKVDKLSISFEPELGDAVRSAAAQAGKPVSAWLAEFLNGWEAEHGVLTAEEIARAERELGLAAGDTAA